MQKILIASPTASNKSYCDKYWIDNILKTNYPNFRVRLFDNTLDNGEYAKSLNDYYKNKYGDNDQFLCIKTNTEGLENSLIARVCQSHNDVRDYALDNNFDALWHVESDVFPKEHFLQELIMHKKNVVGALYYRDEGRFRRLMVQHRRYRSPDNVYTINFDPHDDLNFIDGTVKECAHIGLGAILINKAVLEKIQFRYLPGLEMFPDSFFAEDCFKNRIKIFGDTAAIAEHRNSNWLLEVYKKGVEI